jgi:hypothetical protein
MPKLRNVVRLNDRPKQVILSRDTFRKVHSIVQSTGTDKELSVKAVLLDKGLMIKTIERVYIDANGKTKGKIKGSDSHAVLHEAFKDSTRQSIKGKIPVREKLYSFWVLDDNIKSA